MMKRSIKRNTAWCLLLSLGLLLTNCKGRHETYYEPDGYLRYYYCISGYYYVDTPDIKKPDRDDAWEIRFNFKGMISQENKPELFYKLALEHGERGLEKIGFFKPPVCVPIDLKNIRVLSGAEKKDVSQAFNVSFDTITVTLGEDNRERRHWKPHFIPLSEMLPKHFYSLAGDRLRLSLKDKSAVDTNDLTLVVELIKGNPITVKLP